MSAVIEAMRASHEEVERLERLVTEELSHQPATHYDNLMRSHRIRKFIDRISNISRDLACSYEDNGMLKQEISSLAGQGNDGAFRVFYDQLKDLRASHKRNPMVATGVVSDEFYEQMVAESEQPTVQFSGEEGFGRYVDLHEFHHRYINANFGHQIKYTAYLEQFSAVQPSDDTGVCIPSKLKKTSQYRNYVADLLQYLISFVERTDPLMDIDKILSDLEAVFEEQWTNKGKKELPETDYYHNCGTVEELMELGSLKLKEALVSLGLKSGGTLQQRAERLFLALNTPDLHKLDSKHFKEERKHDKETALMEAKLKKLSEILKETIVQTKEHVENRLAMTYKEVEANRKEQEDEMLVDDMENDEEDDKQEIYNPLKLPMGWDGKPIPYWLYKLHGLGQEFKCEICGNYTYWGRRAFERHFKEARHQHGMRCLGIPNTKSFNEITVIEEAKKLWEQIRQKQEVSKWLPEIDEECEDNEGNIYNKKTYADLQRQGLI